MQPEHSTSRSIATDCHVAPATYTCGASGASQFTHVAVVVIVCNVSVFVSVNMHTALIAQGGAHAACNTSIVDAIPTWPALGFSVGGLVWLSHRETITYTRHSLIQVKHTYVYTITLWLGALACALLYREPYMYGFCRHARIATIANFSIIMLLQSAYFINGVLQGMFILLRESDNKCTLFCSMHVSIVAMYTSTYVLQEIAHASLPLWWVCVTTVSAIPIVCIHMYTKHTSSEADGRYQEVNRQEEQNHSTTSIDAIEEADEKSIIDMIAQVERSHEPHIKRIVKFGLPLSSYALLLASILVVLFCDAVLSSLPPNSTRGYLSVDTARSISTLVCTTCLIFGTCMRYHTTIEVTHPIYETNTPWLLCMCLAGLMSAVQGNRAQLCSTLPFLHVACMLTVINVTIWCIHDSVDMTSSPRELACAFCNPALSCATLAYAIRTIML